MSKEREYQCIHYICEGECDLGKDGTFNNQCQICKTYKKLPGSVPRRKDTRNERKMKALNREIKRGDY